MLEAEQGIERDASVITAGEHAQSIGATVERKCCNKALFLLVLTWIWLVLSYIFSNTG